MLKYVNNINKKLIYKLHIENDKIISMPMFLVDNLCIRNKKELIILLNNAIFFNKKDFLDNYKKVLLKNNNYNNISEDENINNNSKYNNSVNNNITTCNINNPNYNNKIINNKINENKNDYYDKSKFPINKDNYPAKDKLSYIFNYYKYNNEEYDDLINELSKKYSDIDYYNSNYLDTIEDEEEFINYLENIKKNENEEVKEKEYSLVGYIPNDYFFFYFKNRIISIKEFLSFNDLFSFIYLFSKRNDINIMKILAEEYIKKMEMKKDKKVNNKHIVHLLNIFIKLNYEKNNIHNVIKRFLENVYMNVLSNDLKLSALCVSCLSRLHLYNILFYDHISNFLRNIDKCSHLSFSIILHCIGYHKHYLIKKKREVYKEIKSYRNLINKYNENSTEKSNIIEFKKGNNISSEEKNILLNYEKYIVSDIKTNILKFQLSKKNRSLINELENKIIEKLIKIDLQNISGKSISSIFHYYYLINKRTLNEKDQILFSKLIDILIRNNISLIKPRNFLMSSYTLILHKYFTNISISSYFLIQCSKLIKTLKKKIYIENLLFVLIGFSQNQLIFYKNKNSKFPKIYVDKKNNKLCNFKIENKYIDMLEKSENEVNILNKRDANPVSCRSALLNIFDEIINLDYELNKDQILLYLQLFSSFDIKLNADIKQKLYILIINSANDLISSINFVFQLAIKIYGVLSNYMKTIALHYLEKVDFELCKFYKLIKNNEKYFYNYIKGYNFNEKEYSFLCDIDYLSNILFIFDQIDVNKKDFIINLLNFLQNNNYLLLTYKKNKFNSYVYILHYIGCIPTEKEHKKLIDFTYTNLSDYIDLSYKEYLQKKENININNLNDIKKKVNKNENTEIEIDEYSEEYIKNKTSKIVNENLNENMNEYINENYFNEVNHKIINDKIYMKDLILLLDSIRINKAYNYNSLISNIMNMMNTEKIKLLSDEDIELINYIYIDMGLMNKYIMDEAKKRGLTISLAS
ncbi:conserved Plasmodium protein, unknown function [Plasmodium relictum]|uniref:Uncharacterized protein n=1 Tax=Plasmodium relictum TaxID=85471 RepID=A0A1J1HDJ1_PLARL|nr:conserved Plasmodium protein, unknown function [Plasmodium relictum]CRH03134.1 conserved Plasmodium protein, unknown function [Plasmodium relictum]